MPDFALLGALSAQ